MVGVGLMIAAVFPVGNFLFVYPIGPLPFSYEPPAGTERANEILHNILAIGGFLGVAPLPIWTALVGRKLLKMERLPNPGLNLTPLRAVGKRHDRQVRLDTPMIRGSLGTSATGPGMRPPRHLPMARRIGSDPVDADRGERGLEPGERLNSPGRSAYRLLPRWATEPTATP